MFKDKKPSKWCLLALLLVIIVTGLVIFFGIKAQAADRFLPIREITTPGGIKVWMVEDHTLPIIAVKFAFLDSGTALDPEDKQGLARMLSNTLDEGAGDLDSQAFQQALDDHSISLLYTAGRDGLFGEVKTLSRNQDKAFELLSLSLNAPRFDDEAVARMRDGNMTRIRSSLSDPAWMAARLNNDRAYEGHPYSKNSGGTLSSLGRITSKDLRDFKNKYLTQDRLLIAVAGDIKAETLGPAIDKAFGKLPAKGPKNTIQDIAITNPGKTYLFEQSIPQTMVEIILPAFDHKDKDYHALQLTNYIYGGAGFGSRLMENAREKKGLTYGIYSSLQDYRHADAISVSTSTKTESTSEMISIIKEEMLRMQNEPVGEKELADAKSYITGSMPLSLTETDDIASIVLNLRVNALPVDYLDHFAERIRVVTAQDIQRISKRVLKPDSMLTVLVGQPKMDGVEIVKELPNVQ